MAIIPPQTHKDNQPDDSGERRGHQTGVRWLALETLGHVETINYFGARLLEILLDTQKS